MMTRRGLNGSKLSTTRKSMLAHWMVLIKMQTVTTRVLIPIGTVLSHPNRISNTLAADLYNSLGTTTMEHMSKPLRLITLLQS